MLLDNRKIYTLFIILFLIQLLSPSFGATSLFSPPKHNYDYMTTFEPSDLGNWTYTGDDPKFNFDNGLLQLKEERYVQRAILNPDKLSDLNNYGMEFTIKIKQMGNAGDHTRPILMITPRTSDQDFQKQYAVTYYLETMKMGKIVANLYKVHWAIINTNHPNNMKPLVSGHYIMEENTPYIGRISIENTIDDRVLINFFVDGPSDPSHNYQPLLTYEDDSDYKLTNNCLGPAFATIGYDDDVWGHNPLVELDNLKLYSLKAFKERTEELNVYAKTWISKDILKDRYKNTKFLINQRYLLTTLSGDLELNRKATVDDLLFALYAMNKPYYSQIESTYIPLKDELLSSETAAKILYAYYHQPPIIDDYKKILQDVDENALAVHYVYQQGYMPIDSTGQFNPKQIMSRDNLLTLLLALNIPENRGTHGPLAVPDIFNNNAVLQREQTIKFWGSGMTGDTVYITFAGRRYETQVKAGQWLIELPARKASGPYSLRIQDSHKTILYNNIYIGEVFLIAGQSNAEMTIAETKQAKQILNKYKNKDTFRFYYNEHLMAIKPQPSANGLWYNSGDWSISASSAIGTYFADHLLKLNPDLRNMKIGFIRLTYGGSTIELFMPPNTISEINYTQCHQDPIMSGYWNGFMDYISPYPVKAVLYYQGENSSQLRYSYELLLRNYIKGLRDSFANPRLPILLVQITGYGENFYTTDNDSWPIIREVQMRVAKTMNDVGLVATIDLSDKDPLEIHPKDKYPIGKRLAHLAMSLVYKKSNTVKSPEIHGLKKEDNIFYLDVNNVGQGLTYKQLGKNDFEVLTTTGKWLPAESSIENTHTLKVWHAKELSLKGVRYAWRNYPSANYSNSFDLPLLPFNSLVDLTSTNSNHLKTTNFQVKSTNHMMNTFDAIENISRLDSFRMIERVDANIIKHNFYIYGQETGDTINKYKQLSRLYAVDGSSETRLVIPNHKLDVGDWIRNNSRSWTPRKVLAVIDQNTLRIEEIPSQQAGDLIERYQYTDTIIAE